MKSAYRKLTFTLNYVRKMFLTFILIKLIAIYQLLWTIANGSLEHIVQSNSPDSNSNLSLAINFIIESTNSPDDVLIIGSDAFFKNDFQFVAERWRDKVSFALINIDRKHVILKNVQTPGLILIFADQIVYSSLLLCMQQTEYRMRKSKIVFILKSKECADKGFFEQIFWLWSVKIPNFIVVRDCEMTIDVYTYFPYANNNCKQQFSVENIVKMGEFSFNTTSNYQDFTISFVSEYTLNTHEYDTYPSNKLPFFPNKIPLNLNNCQIAVSAYSWPPNVININRKEPGIEIDFIRAIGRQMNGNVSIITSKDPELGLKLGPKGEVTGRLAVFKTEVFDALLPAPVQTSILRDFDITACYLQTALTFIVPAAGIFPSSMILWAVIEKNSNVFLLVIGVVFIVSIIVNSMRKITSKMKYQSKSIIIDFLDIYTTFLRSLVETSTPRLPSHRMMQWIYGLWFAACMIISCYFNTTLTSFFTEPGQLRQIDTVQEIIDSKMQISFRESFMNLIFVQKEYFESKNIKGSVLLGLKRAAAGKAATFSSVSRAEHIAVQWVSSSGSSSIYYIRGGNYFTYWHTLAIYRGNLLFDRVNNLVQRINQCGYWDFQRKRYHNTRLIQIMVRQYLMVHNHQHGISNKLLINKLNKDFHDSAMDDLEGESEKLIMDTNEEEIIQRFVRTDKTLITWSHLSTVFKLWGVGMGLTAVCFVCELLIFRCSNK